jgi:hypothetical protein
MNEGATRATNSTQPAQIKDLDQQIASKKAHLAEQERLLHSARLRFHSYSNAGLYAFENRERRAELWHKIVEQPHHKYLDSGHLPDGSIVDLVLDPADESKTKFICFEPPQDESEEPQIGYSEILADNHHAYLPPEVDPNLLKSIRMPVEAAPYESLNQLISDISQLILRCVAVSDVDASLLAHFVLSTWLIDRLPVAPYLALVGPPQSGKTTLLRVLHLLCRRSLFASDATSVTLLYACHQLHPTLLIDETSSIENPVALRRLLRIGNTPGSLALRHKQAWNVFGAKVICWRELPDDAALNSRCILLPMHGVNDPALRLPDDPEIVSAAEALQSQLLYFRLANYDNVAVRNVELKVALPARRRELYLALAAPCIDHEESHQFVLNYFRESSHAHGDDSLSAVEHAVIVALFLSAHMPEHHGQLLLKDIAARANSCLRDEGESFRLSVRHVGIIATSFGFSRRHRTTNGWRLLLEKSDQRPLHDMAASYGVDHFPENAAGLTRCSLCPNVKPGTRPFATGVLLG